MNDVLVVEAPKQRVIPRVFAALLTALLILAGVNLASTDAQAALEPGDSVWVGAAVYGTGGGTQIWPVWEVTPADPSNPGQPDYWVYCIEHDVTAVDNIHGNVSDLSGFLGAKDHIKDAAVQAKVFWLIQNSYPAISLDELAAAAGLPSISESDAIQATQYAIWAFTEYENPVTNWQWAGNAEVAGLYLIETAETQGGYTLEDIQAQVSVTAPTTAQAAGTLVGPFTVHTNRPTVRIEASSAFALVNASGEAINADAVADGQEIYLDLRDDAAAGSATLTAFAQGSSSAGLIVSSPTQPGGTPTAEGHSQTRILVSHHTDETSASASTQWSGEAPVVEAPVIGTSLVDAADGDRVLGWNGGTVTDTVAYQNLVPGEQYTVSGELMNRADGVGTGITATQTFTPAEAAGSVDLTFTVPEGYAGMSLVAFEWLFEGDVAGDRDAAVAEHTDIEDAAQTVAVEEAPATTPTTPTTPPTTPAAPTPGPTSAPKAHETKLSNTGGETPIFMLGIAALLVLAGITLPMVRRRS